MSIASALHYVCVRLKHGARTDDVKPTIGAIIHAVAADGTLDTFELRQLRAFDDAMNANRSDPAAPRLPLRGLPSLSLRAAAVIYGADRARDVLRSTE